MLLLTACASCRSQSQNTDKMTNETKNIQPLLCDVKTGMCEIPQNQNNTAPSEHLPAAGKPIRLIYFTDPICSSCWGIEPQLRKLKLEYDSVIEIEYRMGGLLPDWNYNSGGISQPSDVAHHWDEASVYYDMPIDGDVWIEDPLASSYPPSIAFKAAQLQSNEKAVRYLRELKERVFLYKKNIAKWEHLEAAAISVGLNADQLKSDYENLAKTAFTNDLQMAREYNVKGFPSIFFTDGAGNSETVYGSKPYAVYESAILKLHPNTIKQAYDKNWKALFSIYQTLTAREFSELSEIPRNESEKTLDRLTEEGHLKKIDTKNGGLWKIKK